jgi:hypothetical protein
MAYRIPIIGVCLVLCAGVEVLRAQCQGQPPRGASWMRAIPDAELTYWFDPAKSEWSNSGITGVVVQAIQDWNAANLNSGLNTYYGPANQQFAGNGQIQVTWGRPVRADGTPCDPLECYGSATRYFDTSGLGFIIKTVIVLDPDALGVTAGNPDYEAIQCTMSHEMGHALGLTHATGAVPSVMHTFGPDRVCSPSDCDKFAVSNYSRIPPPGVPNGGGGVASCPPGGCIGNGTLTCGSEQYYDRSTGWCYPYGEYLLLSQNIKPSINITSPANGSLFAAPLSGSVTSRMIDPDGRVWRVDYHLNGSATPSHSTTQHPFTWSISGVPPGTYSVQAVAYDNANEYTISAPITVNVCGPPPPPTGLWGYSAGGWAYLYWNAVPGVIGYQVEAGTVPGASNVGAWGVGSASLAGPIPPGNYYVRVRVNHAICGLGSPTADILLTVQ